MTTPSTPPLPPPPSEALRRVVDALLDGLPPPPDAQAALSEMEKEEVAGMVRTAHLTRLSLHAAASTTPNAENGETAALQKAQAALQNRVPTATNATPPTKHNSLSAWWARLWKRNQP